MNDVLTPNFTSYGFPSARTSNPVPAASPQFHCPSHTDPFLSSLLSWCAFHCHDEGCSAPCLVHRSCWVTQAGWRKVIPLLGRDWFQLRKPGALRRPAQRPQNSHYVQVLGKEIINVACRWPRAPPSHTQAPRLLSLHMNSLPFFVSLMAVAALLTKSHLYLRDLEVRSLASP